jgi:hypothetical protein
MMMAQDRLYKHTERIVGEGWKEKNKEKKEATIVPPSFFAMYQNFSAINTNTMWLIHGSLFSLSLSLTFHFRVVASSIRKLG